MAIMSDSSIRLKPVIDEPSKPMPSSSAPSSSSLPTAKDFSWPRMSVNHSRMNWMSCSSTSASTSCLDAPVPVVVSIVAINLPFLVAAGGVACSHAPEPFPSRIVRLGPCL